MAPTQQLLGLALFVVLCFGAAAVGGFATAPEIQGWYAGIEKPSWNPPDWIFGPVWTVLYLLMAVAAWLVWRPAGFGPARIALGLFGLQLLLNAAWSWIFFAAHRPGWAAVEIVVLWLAIAATAVAFWHHSRAAAWLLAPYLAWVGFAACLNVAIWRLNSG